MIGIIDYGVGNLQNLSNALIKIGVEHRFVDQPNDLTRFKKLILPGVGAFAYAMDNLRKLGMVEPLRDFIKNGKLLGVCVGMQLLFSHSEEFGNHEGLNLIPGNVTKLKTDKKVPQIGWNKVIQATSDPLFEGIDSGEYFYFVHSYACHPQNQDSTLGKTDYDEVFCSVAHSGNVFGAQFHPEKSSDAGLRFLGNFCNLT